MGFTNRLASRIAALFLAFSVSGTASVRGQAADPAAIEPESYTIQDILSRLPDPVKIRLGAARPKLPAPTGITLKATRPKLPDPAEVTLKARRGKLPDPTQITLAASRPRLPVPTEIFLEARRSSVPDPVQLTLQAVRLRGPKAIVPPVIGLDLTKARGDVESAGLVPAPALGDAPLKRDQLPGHVYSTDPAVGKKVTPGSPVTLTIYGERPKRPVPDVSGLQPDAAAGILAEHDFDPASPATGEAAPDETSVGKVQGSDPPAGTVREIFSAVTLYLFGPVDEDATTEEPQLIAVPPLAGLSLEAANARLREHELTPGLPTLGKPAPTEVEPGTVSGSAPPAGELVAAETVVLPVVWGLHAADVPDVNIADLGLELLENEPPGNEPWEEEPEEPQDPQFTFPEPVFSEPPQPDQPAAEAVNESGWAGRWVLKLTMLPQKAPISKTTLK
jgi:beta-lactam-binding protein with PASTA domain